MELADPAAEDRRDLVRLSDGSIGVDEPLAELVEGSAAMKHEIVAEFGLSEEQPMPTAGLFSFGCGEERREAREPLLAAATRSCGVSAIGELVVDINARDMNGYSSLPSTSRHRSRCLASPMHSRSGSAAASPPTTVSDRLPLVFGALPPAKSLSRGIVDG
jgi:hypothetical protein